MTLENALDFLIRVEGIHSNDPADPGGDTWFGLSRIANADMPWPPTKEQAIERYRFRYWDACKCDNFPWEVALLIFDTAVNHGVAQAITWLQTALKVRADGIVGEITIKAGWNMTPDQLLDVLSYRAVRYAQQPAFWKFGRGWMLRLFHLQQELAKGIA